MVSDCCTRTNRFAEDIELAGNRLRNKTPEIVEKSIMVKLVIWDLDDTLWDGTLAEGPVILAPAHREIIGRLVDRGIMCSVASKNSRAAAESELARARILELIIFSEISYQSKSEMIRTILDRT